MSLPNSCMPRNHKANNNTDPTKNLEEGSKYRNKFRSRNDEMDSESYLQQSARRTNGDR